MSKVGVAFLVTAVVVFLHARQHCCSRRQCLSTKKGDGASPWLSTTTGIGIPATNNDNNLPHGLGQDVTKFNAKFAT